MSKKENKKLGRILKSKNGKNLYIKFQRDVMIKEGTVAFLKKPVDDVKFAISKEWIDETKGAELIDRYSDGGDLSFVRFNIGEPIED